MDEALTAEKIEAALRGNFGRPLRYYSSIGSTNEEAMSWAADGAPEGALVGADHQTAGRGRWGRTWSSEPGQLLQTSTILRPGVHVADAGVITTAVGVACARAVDAISGAEVGIKWPNDVMVDGKKLAGILVESRVDDAGSIEIAIAGVGINVNWAVEDMPDEFRDRATSLMAVLGKPVDRLRLLSIYLEQLEDACRKIETEAGAGEVIEEASARSDILGKDVRVRFLDGTSTTGIAIALDRSGALELQGDERVTVHVGEIEQLRPL